MTVPNGAGVAMAASASKDLRPRRIPVYPVCAPVLPLWNARVAELAVAA